MRLLFIVPCLATLAACATATPTYDQNGQPAMMISCDGSAVPMSVCYNKANEVCPNGYVNLGAQTQNAGATWGAYGGGSIVYKSMMVRCK